mmetsp:Transcript_10684/g.15636  ORF Transcript_10684/g.15636 Transcript_10684/m.15636 type:complete len:210 (-) Transcript_10684:7-636(-)
MVVRKFWKWYNKVNDKYYKTTTILTAGFLYAAGDLTCQGLEYYGLQKKLKKKGEEAIFNTDLRRTVTMTTYGALVFGASSIWWYRMLDKRLSNVFAKIFADEIIYGSVLLVGFFSWGVVANGGTLQDIKDKMSRDFWDTYKVDVTVWPILQFINFYLLPIAYRVLFISICSFFWNIFLSYMQNRSSSDDKAIENQSTQAVTAATTGEQL